MSSRDVADVNEEAATMHAINILFGQGQDLDALQMGMRALVVFGLSLERLGLIVSILLLMLIGVSLGVIIGVLPGLGGANGIATITSSATASMRGRLTTNIPMAAASMSRTRARSRFIGTSNGDDRAS